jgi:hypothetical protein
VIVDREGQNIGGAVATHVGGVQLGHRGFIDEQQREFGLTTNAFAGQNDVAQAGEAGGVDLDFGLFVCDEDLDVAVFSDASSRRPAVGRTRSSHHDGFWASRRS